MDNTRKIEILNRSKEILVDHLSEGTSYICYTFDKFEKSGFISHDENLDMAAFILSYMDRCYSLECWLRERHINVGCPQDDKEDSLRMCAYRKEWIDRLIKELSV